MDSSKTLTALAADRTNGLGALSECTSCVAKEERNGAFTLELKLPQGAKHFSEVTVGGVIKAKAREAGDPQLFRISKITKPMQGVVTVFANHISYDLNKTSVLPFSSTGIVSTLQTMKNRMQGGSAFTLSTDIVNTSGTFSNKVPQSARALFGGQQGSLLDVFGGEYLFDNLQVSLLANRGNDNGVTLRYGKNITDLSQEENIENTYTAIQPYVVDSNENAVLGDLLTVVQSAEPKIMNLDLSDKFSSNGTPTVAQINAAAQQYAEANNIGVPKVSIKVSFVALWQTEEYKNIAPLERVSLCDTVTVVFEKLGVNAKAKVVSTTYDTLRERYTEIEIGDARSTLASTINGISQENRNAVASASGFLDNTIQQFTSLIANGLGLFVTKEAVGETGGNKYYLHNRPVLSESQYQWTVNSNGFAVSQDYGATWTAGIDADGNAVFNSIAANVINAMEINGATINSTRRMIWDYSGTDESGDYSGTITAQAGSVSTNLTANGVSYKHGLVHRGTYSSMGTDVLTDGSIDAIGFDSYNFVGTGRNVYITGQYNESQNAAGIAVEQADNSNIRLIMVARYGSTSKRLAITKDTIDFTFGGTCYAYCNAIARITTSYRKADGSTGNAEVAFPCATAGNYYDW